MPIRLDQGRFGRRGRRVRRPRTPRALEDRYTQAINRVSRELFAVIARDIAPILRDHERAQRADQREIVQGLLRLRLTRLARRRASRLVDQFGRELDRENAEIFEEVIGIPAAEASTATAETLGVWRRNNIELIESIPLKTSDQILEVLSEGLSQGTSPRTLRRLIQERFEVGRSRADLIARDQILKGNAALTQQRQTEVGISSYRWSTSGDDRVREFHADLNGQTFQWNDPPVTNSQGDRNHPGEDYQCRCVAIPILPF